VITPHPELVALATRSRLLAVDPGLKYPAAAAFNCGVLLAASRVRLPRELADLDGVDRGERCRQVAEHVCAWAVGAFGGALPELVVCEFPQIYTREKSKGDPNTSLVPLAGIDVAIAARLCVRVVAPYPGEWVGQIPKATSGPAWVSVRGRIIRSRLLPGEFERIEETHDAVDSVGVGKWILGMLGKTFPGAA
jgi:hypothetical protein